MRWTLRGVGLVSIIITARLLTPQDFGIVTQGAIVQGLALSLFDIRASMVLIREVNPTREDIDSAWTVALIQGVFVGVLIMLFAFPASWYFREEKLVMVVLVVGLSTIVVAAENVGLVLLRKELQFAKDFWFSAVRRIAAAGVTIALAVWLRTYWALVLGMFIGALIECALSYVFHPYRPRFCLTSKKKYFAFGMSMIPMNVARYIRGRADMLIVGASTNTAGLGGYSVASELSSAITQEITAPLNRALFPNYATLLADRARLASVFSQVLGLVALVTLPIAAVLSVLAPEVIAVVLGDKWLEYSVIVAWLAIYGAVQSISGMISGNILIVGGFEKKSSMAIWTQLLVLLPAALVGAYYANALGVAVAITLGSIALLPMSAWFLRTAYGITIRASMASLLRPTLACIGMALITLWVMSHLHGMASPFFRLVIGGCVAVLSYVGMVYLLWRMWGRPQGPEMAVQEFLKKLRNRFAR